LLKKSDKKENSACFSGKLRYNKQACFFEKNFYNFTELFQNSGVYNCGVNRRT